MPWARILMRLAIVTGGSRGLGLALCNQLAAQQYRVIEFSRNAPHSYSLPIDLASPEAAHAAMASCMATLNLEHLQEVLIINNAGTLIPIGAASNTPFKALLANLTINFTSAIAILSEMVRVFQPVACRKVLATITSSAALKGYSGWSLYCASKAGMEGYIRALGVEQQGETYPLIPISIDPGVMDTDMQALIRATDPTDFPEVERFRQRQAEGGLTPPEAVAAAVLRIIKLSSLEFGGRYETRKF